MKFFLIASTALLLLFAALSYGLGRESKKLITTAKDTGQQVSQMNAIIENKQQLDQIAPKRDVLTKFLPKAEDVVPTLTTVGQKDHVEITAHTDSAVGDGSATSHAATSIKIHMKGDTPAAIRSFIKDLETGSMSLSITSFSLSVDSAGKAEGDVEAGVFTQ